MNLEVIRPVVELELKNGCDNESHADGFDKFIVRIVGEYFDSKKSDKYKTAFSKYQNLSISDREILVRHLKITLSKKVSSKTMKKVTNQKAFELSDNISVISGIGKKISENLSRVGIITIEDALRYIPTRYIDLTKIKTIRELETGETISVIAIARDLKQSRNRQTLNAIFSDETGTMRVTFFNAPWMTNKITIGNEYTLSGNVLDFGGPQMTNPDIKEGEYEGSIIPVYPSVKGINQWVYARLFKGLIPGIPAIPEILPVRIKNENHILSKTKSFFQIHKPDSISDTFKARNSLALEELILLETALLKRRANLKSQPGITITNTFQVLEKFKKNLPFEPTNAQKRCIDEINDDLESGKPMNRLLHGDVGSGKTVVGLAGIHAVISAGYQTAWIAPTEVLASQTYKSAKEFLDFEVRYLSGSTKKSERKEIAELLASETPCLLIGTHAVIEDWVKMPKLGMVIVDEQHRFGVRQRAKLSRKAKLPHVLVMSATPIPRTLAMTFFGDLDVSVVDEKPAGRIPVKTKVYTGTYKSAAYKKAVSEIKNGRQIFVVCPLVEESEKISAVSATEMFEELQESYFKEFKCELLHGRMKSILKNEIMDNFKKGEIDVLVSTTVIEVGVDVPNATVMIIENAERFGLAQLHQLRGRVGRSNFQSYCYLLPSRISRALSVLESTNDGLKVAEEDLRIRGPGDMGGTMQSGIPLFDTKLINPSNLSLLPKARKIAEDIIDKDPKLQDKQNLKMKEEIIKRFEKRVGMVWIS